MKVLFSVYYTDMKAPANKFHLSISLVYLLGHVEFYHSLAEIPMDDYWFDILISQGLNSIVSDTHIC